MLLMEKLEWPIHELFPIHCAILSSQKVLEQLHKQQFKNLLYFWKFLNCLWIYISSWTKIFKNISRICAILSSYTSHKLFLNWVHKLAWIIIKKHSWTVHAHLAGERTSLYRAYKDFGGTGVEPAIPGLVVSNAIHCNMQPFRNNTENMHLYTL